MVSYIIREDDRCRFYKKADLAKENILSKKELSWLGDNEVFETNFTSKVYADLLNGKCTVWDVLEYDGKSGLGATDYYTRARYLIDSVSLLHSSSRKRLVLRSRAGRRSVSAASHSFPTTST